MSDRGSKLGLHSIVPGQAMPLVRAAAARGAIWPVVKGVDNAGLAIDVKAVAPQTITITRFVNEKWDSAQDCDTWGDEVFLRGARETIQQVFDRTNADERKAADFFEVLNEADPPGVAGWRALGRFCCEVVREADRRDLKVMLPAFNAGTPEWDELQAFVDSGLFALMKAGGHVLSVHEGVFGKVPMDTGFGDRIPGAPVVAGAGSMCGRYRYLYHLLEQRGEVVPCVVSEFYTGDYYSLPPAQQLARLAWYDQRVRSDPNILAVLGFTIDPSPGWAHQNYTQTYVEAVLDYLVAEKDKPNVAEVPMARVLGVDVSEYQPPNLPWLQWVEFGVAFAIVRASIGYRQDVAYPMHRDRAKAAGLPTGLYHALLDSNPPGAEPMDFDPVRQAQVFWSRRQPGDELPLIIAGRVIPRWWVDLEALGVTAAALSAFLREFRRIAPGVLIGIYTSRYFWLGLIGPGHTEFADEIWWLAAYDADPPPLPDVAKREKVVLFQFRYKRGYLPAYPNDLDVNWLLDGVTGPLPEPPPAEEEDEMDEQLRVRLVELGNGLKAKGMALQAEAQALLDLLPPPTQTKHTLAELTNQQVINLFAAAFGTEPRTAPVYIAKIGQALTGPQQGVLFAKDGAGNRTALYTGPAVEDMPLSSADRASLISVLAPA